MRQALEYETVSPEAGPRRGPMLPAAAMILAVLPFLVLIGVFAHVFAYPKDAHGEENREALGWVYGAYLFSGLSWVTGTVLAAVSFRICGVTTTGSLALCLNGLMTAVFLVLAFKLMHG